MFARTKIAKVSTHSRPKAAASLLASNPYPIWFQHTAARRRLLRVGSLIISQGVVSTHSRPKAAAIGLEGEVINLRVSTHSRPKAAAPYLKKQEKSAY